MTEQAAHRECPDYDADGALTDAQLRECIKIARDRLQLASLFLGRAGSGFINHERAASWLERAEEATVIARHGLEARQ